MALRIHVDHDRCRGAGQCALNAPELFDQSDDDGTVVVLDDRPPPELHASARLAAALCPNSVISVVEDDGDENSDESQERANDPRGRG